MFDLDEINIEEHEETRKQFQSKLGKEKGNHTSIMEHQKKK